MNRFFLATAMILILASCKTEDDSGGPLIDLTGKIVIPNATRDTVLFVNAIDNIQLPIFISIPSSSVNLPGTVVMHGSGGNWQDSDTNNDGVDDTIVQWELSNQNDEWKSMLDNENIVSAFPGSYFRRGTVENEGEWKNPPLQFQISASFVRNYDAFNTLELLRSLVREDGTPIVQSNNVAILGFSHGATAVQSTLFDTQATPVDWEWSQSYSGTLYTNEIRSPAPTPESGGFVAGVMYYPGSFHNSYYGNPCNGTSIFQTTIDFMIHLASEDPLTSNSNCMLETVSNNGGGVATIHNYQDANHGFDNKTNGVDGQANTLARQRSMTFLKDRLGID
ncbi:dienelactone hydrolase family protein [Roseivirga sp. E12]|uniref:dienelactone hydrolase family protein n=1 Tax=Roseivirga sp. E12 TaxID=2819237 RepID=UPI001ABC04C5|nr:dienelactone hydrolase family protein [Roseivirga sp. E12]MBO3697207.1 dienelactone hydrolase family protein [Roseivirga sp. E12]